MKNTFLVLLLYFVLASCGEEKPIEADKTIQERAESGEAKAQNTLGVMYALGNGVAQDFAEAIEWYRKAAEQGNEDAKTWLGMNTKENGE